MCWTGVEGFCGALVGCKVWVRFAVCWPSTVESDSVVEKEVLAAALTSTRDVSKVMSMDVGCVMLIMVFSKAD